MSIQVRPLQEPLAVIQGIKQRLTFLFSFHHDEAGTVQYRLVSSPPVEVFVIADARGPQFLGWAQFTVVQPNGTLPGSSDAVVGVATASQFWRLEAAVSEEALARVEALRRESGYDSVKFQFIWTALAQKLQSASGSATWAEPRLEMVYGESDPGHLPQPVVSLSALKWQATLDAFSLPPTRFVALRFPKSELPKLNEVFQVLRAADRAFDDRSDEQCLIKAEKALELILGKKFVISNGAEQVEAAKTLDALGIPDSPDRLALIELAIYTVKLIRPRKHNANTVVTEQGLLLAKTIIGGLSRLVGSGSLPLTA